jgi:AcrR family transcriptional regulator
MDTETGITSLIEDPELVVRRRRQIVAAATKLFADQGFYRTTMKDIAKLAGISAGLVYQYVREKEDVLLLVLLEVVDGYAQEIPRALEGVTDPLERLVKAVDAYCRVVDRHRAGTVLAYRSTKSLSPERRELIQARELETNAFITAAIADCIKRGLLRKVNVDVLTYQFVLIAHGWALKGWFFKSRLSLDDYIKDSLDAVFNGALSSVGARRYRELGGVAA